jgi:hypothetical protein
MTEDQRERQVENIVHVCYEAIRAYVESIGVGDFPVWQKAPKHRQQMYRDGVEYYLGLLEVGRSANPARRHRAWVDEKIADGWRYGAKIDADRKEHPWILDFEQLPVEKQCQDHIFAAVVAAIWTSTIKRQRELPLVVGERTQ